MAEMQFGSEIEEYSVNGKKIIFRPGDPTWVDSCLGMIDNIEHRIAGTPEQNAEIKENPRAVFRIAREHDLIIREEIDSVLGEGVSKAAYDGNMCTLDNGLPIWFHFIFMISDKVLDCLAKHGEASNASIKKYRAKLEKYKRK